MGSTRKTVERAGAGSSTGDRRRDCRYAPTMDAAWVGWWENSAFRSTAAKILDVSLRGARLTVAAFPPADKPIWFCPPGQDTSGEWIEVVLVGSRKKLFGPREVRIAFRTIFPYDTFKAVVYGPDAMKGAAPLPYVPEDAHDRDWW